MIPKIIHYIWLGNNNKPDLVKKCIQSWNEHLTDYKIIEWNENNINIDKIKKESKFFKKMYENEAWAFASDYLRLKILLENGGIYMDTDMLVLKKFDCLLKNQCFFGYEKKDVINGAIIGAKKNANFIRKALNYYDEKVLIKNEYTIPQILTSLYKDNNESDKKEVNVYPVNFFYPLPYKNKNESFDKYITKDSYTVHLWSNSWSSNKTMALIKTKHMNGVKKWIYYLGYLLGLNKLILKISSFFK